MVTQNLAALMSSESDRINADVAAKIPPVAAPASADDGAGEAGAAWLPGSCPTLSR